MVARRLAAAAAMLLALLLTPAVAGASACAGAEEEAATLAPAAAASTLACLVNEERAARGLRALRPSERLRRAGQRHSDAMVYHRFFGHVGPDGASLDRRVRATGYHRGVRSWRVGEALALGEASASRPSALIAALLGSDVHRTVLFDPAFVHLGVGVTSGVPVASSGLPSFTVGLVAGRSTRRR